MSDFTMRIMRKNTTNATDIPLTISSKEGLINQNDFFNKQVASKDMSGYYLLHRGEYAYNKSYSVGYDFGSIKRLEKYDMGALSTLYICFALTKFNSDFIKHYFDSLKWYREIYMISAEGARNHGLLNVPTEDFFATLHTLPTDEAEQAKIASFLDALTARIEKQRSLVENLKKYKRGAVKRIFANKGDWAKYKISDIAHIATGHSNTQDKAEDGAFPFFIRSQTVARSNRYLYDGEAVLTIGDGQIGKVFHYYVGKFDCHQRVYMMTQFKNTTGKYFYHYFASFFYDRVIRMSAKNTVDSVRYDMIAEMPIYIPSPETQQKIVKALDLLDARITTAESLLDLYEKEKNALLQKMFI